MKSSRILSTAALAMLCVNCGGPSTIASAPNTAPQTTRSNQAASEESPSGLSPLERRRLFWRPDRLTLQKGVKQMAKLFYHGERPLRIADDCTGRVALDQIGFARIKA